MRLRRVVVGIVAGLAAVVARAEPLIVTDFLWTRHELVTVDSESLAVLSSVEVNPVSYDATVGADGYLYTGASGGVVRSRFDGTVVDWWLRVPDAFDIDFRSNGNLMVLDRAFGNTPESEIVEYAPDGTVVWHDDADGFDIMGMTVPRSGPYEDGILAIALEPGFGPYVLFRWRPDVSGMLVREGPLGPIEVGDFTSCERLRGGCALHPTAAHDGLSFFTVEGGIGRIQQHDLDGNLLRTFAEIAPDPVAISSSIPGTDADAPSNIVQLEDGAVFVTTWRRLYRFEADGTLTARADHIFAGANAVTPARPMPFESAGVPCRPWSVGFWKRQCASQGLRRSPVRGHRGGDPPAPPVHPAYRDANLPAVIVRADAWLAPHGTTACAALQPDTPNTWREKALRRYAAIALNVEDRRLGRRCAVVVDGATIQVGAALAEMEALLGSVDDDDLKRAFQLAGMILGEE